MSDNSTVLFCGTTFNVAFACPSASSDGSTTFMRFTGGQYLGTMMGLNSNDMTVRMRVRTVNATGGLLSIVSSFALTTIDHDRDLYFENGKVCSRLWVPGEEVICTTGTYNDNMWHTIERGFAAGQTIHYLKVDNEIVSGSSQRVAEWSPAGIVVGVCSRNNTTTCGSSGLTTFFAGDIDYVTISPIAVANARWEFTTVTGPSTARQTNSDTGDWPFVCGSGVLITNWIGQISAPMNCPSFGSADSRTYAHFDGSQYMSAAVRFASDTQWIRLELRTTALNGGILGMNGWLAPGSPHHDQEIFLNNGRICSRLLSNSQEEVLCTTGTYNDGNWHYIERKFGLGNGTKHYLQVDTEAVQGNLIKSDYTEYTGITLGMSGYNQVASYFTGDIDYLYNAALGTRNGVVR